jgi:hypothetical protein
MNPTFGEIITAISVLAAIVIAYVANKTQKSLSRKEMTKSVLKETWERIDVYTSIVVTENEVDLYGHKVDIVRFFKKNKPFYTKEIYIKLFQLLEEQDRYWGFRSPHGHYELVEHNSHHIEWVEKNNSKIGRHGVELKIEKLKADIENFIRLKLDLE